QVARLLVADEHGGGAVRGGRPDDRGAQRERLGDVEVQVERRVLAVAQLDHARDAHEIDARAEVEAADDRRAGEDQDRELLEAVDERVREGAAAAEVAEAERVVAVDEYAAVRTPAPHRPLPQLIGRNSVGKSRHGQDRPCTPRRATTPPAWRPAGDRTMSGP